MRPRWLTGQHKRDALSLGSWRRAPSYCRFLIGNVECMTGKSTVPSHGSHAILMHPTPCCQAFESAADGHATDATPAAK